jgi:hypothetical protein
VETFSAVQGPNAMPDVPWPLGPGQRRTSGGMTWSSGVAMAGAEGGVDERVVDASRADLIGSSCNHPVTWRDVS